MRQNSAFSDSQRETPVADEVLVLVSHLASGWKSAYTLAVYMGPRLRLLLQLLAVAASGCLEPLARALPRFVYGPSRRNGRRFGAGAPRRGRFLFLSKFGRVCVGRAGRLREGQEETRCPRTRATAEALYAMSRCTEAVGTPYLQCSRSELGPLM